MHNKFALVETNAERSVVFGSLNWSRNSQRFNREIAFVAEGAACSAFGLAELAIKRGKDAKPLEPRWKIALARGDDVNTLAITESAVVLGAIRDGGRGSVIVAKRSDGTKIAELALRAAPVYDGLALADGSVFVALENGQIVCLGPAR